MKGMIVEPSLPIAAQKPKPKVLVRVLKDYVVKGYSI